jgi:hypothetical protein
MSDRVRPESLANGIARSNIALTQSLAERSTFCVPRRPRAGPLDSAPGTRRRRGPLEGPVDASVGTRDDFFATPQLPDAFGPQPHSSDRFRLLLEAVRRLPRAAVRNRR